MIDLTQPLSSAVPTWDGSCGFCLKVKSEGLFCVQEVAMDAGIGTHMDAPAHIIPGGLSIGEIPCEQLIAPAAIIDCDDELSLKDVREYESTYGPIPPHALVIAFTGWSRFWSDPIAYRNELRFPTFSAEAAQFLLDQREIVGIAIDTLSPDRPDSTFPVHKLILGAGKYIIENVGDCSSMPKQGGYVACFPLRCDGATESPIRMVGFSPLTSRPISPAK